MLRKSQITVFLILGIIIISSFALLMYLRRETTTKKFDKQVTTVAIDEIKIQEIKNYIQSCIDKTFTQGLELITKQGGFILDYQPGSLLEDPIPYIEFQGYNVSYHIFRPNLHPKGSVAPPPYYPCYISDPDCKYGVEYCCGINPDYYKCDWAGMYCYFKYNHTQTENFELGMTRKPKLCTYSFIVGGYECLCSNEPCSESIQAQLEYYIADQINECLNFSVFRGYNITIGNAISNITIGSENVGLDMKLPVTIKLADYAPTKKEMRFNSEQSVRLLQLYTLVFGKGITRGLIDYEMKNMSFDILVDGETIANEYGYFKISKREVPINKTSIIIINDTSDYKLNGKNVIFQFAVEYRNPALNYFQQNRMGKYDVYVNKGDPIIITPDAYDLDEHNLIIRYHGWLTDSPGPDGLNLEAVYPENIWQNSDYYKNGVLCPHPYKGLQLHVCANYTTGDDDVGEHKVTIEVTDSYYKDWQTLNIYVNDVFQPQIYTLGSCYAKGTGTVVDTTIKDKFLTLYGDAGVDDCDPPYIYIWGSDPEPPTFPIYTKYLCTDEVEAKFQNIDDYYIDLTVRKDFTDRDAPRKRIRVFEDEDGDGFCGDGPGGITMEDYSEDDWDCDDTETLINPNEDEICGNGIDDDCDGLKDTFDPEGCI